MCQNDCNSGANDDCVRPNGFEGGTPLPKSSFDDGLHDTGFISPLTLVRFHRYSRSFYLSGYQPPCHSQRVALPDLQKKRSKLHFKDDHNQSSNLPLYVVIVCGMLDHLLLFWLSRASVTKETLMKMGAVVRVICKACTFHS